MTANRDFLRVGTFRGALAISTVCLTGHVRDHHDMRSYIIAYAKQPIIGQLGNNFACKYRISGTNEERYPLMNPNLKR